MRKTRNGVFYDLKHSVYKFIVPDTNMTYIFSSDLHLVKFEEQYNEHRKEFNTKFEARFRLHFELKNIPDLLLYKKIETRGFLVTDEGGQLICLENLKCVGDRVTLRS